MNSFRHRSEKERIIFVMEIQGYNKFVHVLKRMAQGIRSGTITVHEDH